MKAAIRSRMKNDTWKCSYLEDVNVIIIGIALKKITVTEFDVSGALKTTTAVSLISRNILLDRFLFLQKCFSMFIIFIYKI